ncbi:MAG TPA: ABC-F family ATP-binding cassette domain-containing protein [Geminicoccaceae bacterium]|nr:ABC-F family ATP-binding cassette domain-containing protein [Geminicoccaceae bacterium]
MLHLNDVTLRVGGRLLLESATMHVPAGQRVGLVGRNGSGKTSLLRLIRGETQPDAGTLRLRKGASIGWVAQEAPGGDATPREVVLAADRERERLLAEAERTRDPAGIAEVQTRLADIGAHAAPARAAAILSGLGFDEAAQMRPLASFSGGWRMRVALAAVLFAEPDLLLLDEPTNHLDLEASMWLEDYLCRYRHTLLLVSHDRNLLNRVPQRIVHLDQLRLTSYAGGYEDFVRVRNEQLALQAKERTKVEAKRRHMQAFVDRFRYKASKARQAQSRLKAIEKLATLPAAPRAPDVVLRFPAAKIPAPPLITMDRVKAGYGDRVVLDRLDLRIDPDDRIALLGANGNGKSTFAKLLAGTLAPMGGELVCAPKLRVGYFAQHQIEELVPGQSAVQHLARRLPDEREERLRTRLGGFGFSQEKADLPAALLSGGEKARLTFALMSALAPQILILDEPTNHLDVDSRDALIDAINDFAGAVILISHDRHLIELTADRLWLVADGRVQPFEGDIDGYRRDLLGGRGNGDGRRGERQRGAEQRQRLAPLRQAARQAEREFEQLTRDRSALTARLANAETYRLPGAELEALAKRNAELEAAIAVAEARWLEAEQALEQAQA